MTNPILKSSCSIPVEGQSLTIWIPSPEQADISDIALCSLEGSDEDRVFYNSLQKRKYVPDSDGGVPSPTKRVCTVYNRSVDSGCSSKNETVDYGTFSPNPQLKERIAQIETLLNLDLPSLSDSAQKKVPKGRLNTPWFRTIFNVSDQQSQLTVESIFHGWNSKTVEQQLWILDLFQRLHNRLEVSTIAQISFPSHGAILRLVKGYVEFKRCLPHLWTLAASPEVLTTKPQTIDTRTLAFMRKYFILYDFNVETPIVSLANVRTAYGLKMPSPTAGSAGAPAVQSLETLSKTALADSTIVGTIHDLYGEHEEALRKVHTKLKEDEETYDDVLRTYRDPLLDECDREMIAEKMRKLTVDKLKALKRHLNNIKRAFQDLDFPELQKFKGKKTTGQELVYAIFPELGNESDDQQIWFLRFLLLYLSNQLLFCDEFHYKEEGFKKDLEGLQTSCTELRTHFRDLMTMGSNISRIDIPNPVKIPGSVAKMIKRLRIFVDSDVELDALQAFPIMTSLTIGSFRFEHSLNIKWNFPELTELKFVDPQMGNTFMLEGCRKLRKIIITHLHPNLLSLMNHPIPLEIQVENLDLEHAEPAELFDLATMNRNITITKYRNVKTKSRTKGK